MRALTLRRLALWSVLGVVLAVLVLAMVIVWTANDREWFIDSAGISATLDMTLTDGGRWLATAVLGVMMALVLLAFVTELATANPSRGPGRTGPVIPSLEERDPPRPARDIGPPPHHDDDYPTQRLDPARYASTVVGDRDTRRVEQSLPAPGRADADVAASSDSESSNVPASPRDEQTPSESGEAGSTSSIRLRPAGRQ